MVRDRVVELATPLGALGFRERRAAKHHPLFGSPLFGQEAVDARQELGRRRFERQRAAVRRERLRGLARRSERFTGSLGELGQRADDR